MGTNEFVVSFITVIFVVPARDAGAGGVNNVVAVDGGNVDSDEDGVVDVKGTLVRFGALRVSVRVSIEARGRSHET